MAAKSDRSRKFILRGGPYDKMTVRLYPNIERQGERRILHWPNLEFAAGTYVHPRAEDQHEKRPYLLHQQRITPLLRKRNNSVIMVQGAR